ncbi:hypothetical protein MEZE111188_01930 [Mesobacillus zeae]
MRYSFLILLGSFCYGLLSTIVKLGLLDGYSIQDLVGGQYVFGWIGLFMIVLLFSRHRVSKKNLITLLTVGTTMSMTGIFYGFAVEELSASIAVLLLFQFTWMGVFIEAVATRTFPIREKVISILILFVGTLLAGGVFEALSQNFTWRGTIFGLLIPQKITADFFILYNRKTVNKKRTFLRFFLRNVKRSQNHINRSITSFTWWKSIRKLLHNSSRDCICHV